MKTSDKRIVLEQENKKSIVNTIWMVVIALGMFTLGALFYEHYVAPVELGKIQRLGIG